MCTVWMDHRYELDLMFGAVSEDRTVLLVQGLPYPVKRFAMDMDP